MRITVVSIDTRGGIQPYTALALGLAGAGHDVQLVAPGDFAPMIESRGLPVAPLSGNMEQTVRESEGIVERGRLARLRMERQALPAQLGAWLSETLEACAGADVLLGGIGGGMVGRSVAEKLGVPFLTAHLQPVEAPTSAFPGVLLPQVPSWLGGAGRRASHAFTDAALSLPHGKALAEARVEVLALPAKPPQSDRQDPELPMLYGFSRHVVPPPADWGPHRHVTGYWRLPAGRQWTPPAELEAFLAAGPPPVCIGFGSMPTADPRAMSDLVLTAVRRAGVRAVLLSGWGGLADALADDDAAHRDVYLAEEVPHDWLYPRAAAAVHHGGAGTTGASLHAGLPTLVVPFAVDQPFWGSRVAALGAGPAPLPRKRLTVDALAGALQQLTTDDAMRRRAAALGQAIRAEDGVAEAVRHVTAAEDTIMRSWRAA